VQCQVQHQLAVTGKHAADVCVLICGQEIKIHRIERDEAMFTELVQVRVNLDDGKKREDFLRQQIQQRMGDSSKAVFATGSVSWKRSKDSLSLDVATLLQEQPELLSKYPLTRAGSRRFLVHG
jgi:hypothetical protein